MFQVLFSDTVAVLVIANKNSIFLEQENKNIFIACFREGVTPNFIGWIQAH